MGDFDCTNLNIFQFNDIVKIGYDTSYKMGLTERRMTTLLVII